MIRSIRDLIEDYPGDTQGAPNPSLHDLARENPPLLLNRTEVEDTIHACVPDGDTNSDVAQHILYTPPNPYFGRPYTELNDLLETTEDMAEYALVRSAMGMMESRHRGDVAPREPSKYVSKTPGRYQVDKQISIRAGNGLKSAH